MPRKVSQRVWVHALGPPRKPRMPECVGHEECHSRRAAGLLVLLLQTRLVDVAAAGFSGEYPFAAAKLLSPPIQDRFRP